MGHRPNLPELSLARRGEDNLVPKGTPWGNLCLGFRSERRHILRRTADCYACTSKEKARDGVAVFRVDRVEGSDSETSPLCKAISMKRTPNLTLILFLLLLVSCPAIALADARPNILFAIMDDASYPHMGAYGCDWVRTPAFDRVARDGILFTNGYTSNAKCAPSRASVLTGRNSWELGQLGVHIAVWPGDGYKTYCEVLADNGYHVGRTGKGWSPGIVESGVERELTGRVFNKLTTNPPAEGISSTDYAANFEAFLDANRDGKAWCFWYGGHEPHRGYEYGSGVSKGGKKTFQIDEVPGFWPDNETIRNDLLDYAFEIEYFDRHLGEMLKLLEERGELENTLIVVTADNGMPFPRCKGLQYEYSNHMPLAMMWLQGVRNAGRTESAYVSFVDFAPTFLKVAGVEWEASGMEPTSGKELTDVFEDGYRKYDRSYVLLGQERHDYGRPRNQGYPIRSIIQDGFLYLHNFKPQLWPAGNPETGYLNTDGSPTKTVILDMRRNDIDAHYWALNFGKHPEEELYHIAVDPECLVNLAGKEAYQEVKETLKARLFEDLERQGDPRVVGPDGDIFDRYPFARDNAYDFYERYMRGEIEGYQTGWVEPSDYETEPIE